MLPAAKAGIEDNSISAVVTEKLKNFDMMNPVWNDLCVVHPFFANHNMRSLRTERLNPHELVNLTEVNNISIKNQIALQLDNKHLRISTDRVTSSWIYYGFTNRRYYLNLLQVCIALAMAGAAPTEKKNTPLGALR